MITIAFGHGIADTLNVVVNFIIGFVLAVPVVKLCKAFLKFLGVYTIVQERQAKVYTLFGKVIGTLDEPGLYWLWFVFGPSALILHIFGKCHTVDMRIDQQYLRSQTVNSEEGAPMGVGLWYEMYINDPVAYIFRNNDPRGSLAANVGSSIVRCLSNLPLESMLENRHFMSVAVRKEVSPKSQEWGYRLGSCYIRKVHFRDPQMMKQIQNKVVNRLRQVTSAIKEEGDNRVKIISSTADKTAANDFGKAAGIRAQIVGETFSAITQEPEIGAILMEVMENDAVLKNNTPIVIMPDGANIMITTEGDTSPIYRHSDTTNVSPESRASALKEALT